MVENISPEERLFRVIQENKKKPAEQGSSSPEVSVIARQRSLAGFSFVKGFFLHIDSGRINNILACFLAALIYLVIYSASQQGHRLDLIKETASNIRLQTINVLQLENFKSVNFYVKEAQKRDLFKPVVKTEVKKGSKVPAARESREKLKKLIQGLKLVGISWGKDPKAMIRSEKENNTYFLRKEQFIGGTGIKIKAIFKDKVIVSYFGEEMEL